MAKRKELRKVKKAGLTVVELALWLAGIIVALVSGALLISGALMNTFLSFLGLTVHKIVGWISIIGILLGALIRIFTKGKF